MDVNFDYNKNILSAKEAAEFLVGLHLNTLANFTDCRFDLSVAAISKVCPMPFSIPSFKTTTSLAGIPNDLRKQEFYHHRNCCGYS